MNQTANYNLRFCRKCGRRLTTGARHTGYDGVTGASLYALVSTCPKCPYTFTVAAMRASAAEASAWRRIAPAETAA